MNAAATISVIAEEVLEGRLRDWAHEYGGSRYATIGKPGPHILARLIEFGGFLPGATGPRGMASLTAADEVERIVKRLAGGWPGHARVIRLDYFSPDMAMEGRLDLLRRQGFKMGRSSYFHKLESAKLYVASSL